MTPGVPSRAELVLPAWVAPWLAGRETTAPTEQDQVDLVLGLASEHVERGSGGPFAAAVFEASSGRLLAVGVNLVVASAACTAHAEMVALALAGRALGTFDLGAGAPTVLVASTEPCAMCLGAIPWSGVSKVVCSARDEDARALGFDEGDKLAGWVSALSARGIRVVRDVDRPAGQAVLDRYAALGGRVYNPSATRS